MSDTLPLMETRKNSASAAFSFVRRIGDNNERATKSHEHDFNSTMNKFVKQCAQCALDNKLLARAKIQDPTITEQPRQEYHNINNVKFFPAERETFSDGKVIVSEDRYYCKSCMASWGDAYDGMTYEEWSDLQPIKVERLHN